MTIAVHGLPALARNAWASALSRGVGYEPQPPGCFDDRTVGDYFTDLRAKTSAPGSQAPDRLGPATVAQLALGWWSRLIRGDATAGHEFDRLCAGLERRAEERANGAYWPYHVSVPKYGLSPPWYSALAQGQVASVFVRAHLRSGAPRHAELAVAAVRPLDPALGTDLVTATPAGPVLEEAPGPTSSQILNGWVYALWGLWDVAVGLRITRAHEIFEASACCFTRWIDRYDTGWWTRYSLLPGPRDDLAKPFYHRLHVDQVEIMYRLTGSAVFQSAGRRWRAYDRAPNRVRAIAGAGRAAISRR